MSTFVTITGCLGALPVRSSPVSGQYVGSGAALVSCEVGSEGEAAGALSSSPPPHPASSSEAATMTAAAAVEGVWGR